MILWKSKSYLFVIDGGHRLSALKAWVDDDYGDGPVSMKYFGNEISREQKSIADRTRKMVNEKVGSWSHIKQKMTSEELSEIERAKLSTIITRGLPIQWVKGDAEKAEGSFFNINMKGTPLDEVEELLLKSRKKPISIAARAIIRAGKGHKYWSAFTPESASAIEKSAAELHKILFDPELKTPVKTLDLPLGGSKGVRMALQLLIDFMLIANRNQLGNPKTVYDQEDDEIGNATVQVLRKSATLANRITGNGNGSLGLHPAVYFYGPTGRHSSPMFMGTVLLIAQKLSNNNGDFFRKFTSVREKLEGILIKDKDLISTILQKHMSRKRVEKYCELLDSIINALLKNEDVTEDSLIVHSHLQGKVVAGNAISTSSEISGDTKSQVFINIALKSAVKCEICHGYIDMDKSVSYDHILRVRDGGCGNSDNIQLTHPYCNQSVRC